MNETYTHESIQKERRTENVKVKNRQFYALPNASVNEITSQNNLIRSNLIR